MSKGDCIYAPSMGRSRYGFKYRRVYICASYILIKFRRLCINFCTEIIVVIVSVVMAILIVGASGFPVACLTPIWRWKICFVCVFLDRTYEYPLRIMAMRIATLTVLTSLFPSMCKSFHSRDFDSEILHIAVYILETIIE